METTETVFNLLSSISNPNALLKLNQIHRSSFFKSVFLSFIEEIGSRTSQINDFRTSISIAFKNRAFFAVISVAGTGSTADHASSLKKCLMISKSSFDSSITVFTMET